jgi:hypothetical protein
MSFADFIYDLHAALDHKTGLTAAAALRKTVRKYHEQFEREAERQQEAENRKHRRAMDDDIPF